MKCEECGEEISERRLKILPNTTVCVKCSTESAKQFEVTEALSFEDDELELVSE